MASAPPRGGALPVVATTSEAPPTKSPPPPPPGTRAQRPPNACSPADLTLSPYHPISPLPFPTSTPLTCSALVVRSG